MTAYTITDPELLARIAEAKDYLELRDPSGYCVGRVEREWLGKMPPGVVSPFSDEQLDGIRKQPGGRPLQDILRDLEGRAR